MDKKLITGICLVLVLTLTTTGALAQNPNPRAPEFLDLAEHVPGELLIRFSPGMTSTQAINNMAEMGVRHKREISALKVHVVKLPQGLSVEQAVERFSHRPGVDFVEPNYILQIEGVNQEEITDQWALDKIQALQAWSTFSEEQKIPITLATVDSGIDPNHNDLVDNMWSNSGEIPGNGLDDDDNGYIDDNWGWDFVNNDNDPFDDNLHGTAVSSVMAGDYDGDGVAGICPWCKVMAVKVMSAGGTGTLDVVANGIVYATDAGARVINLSLAGIAGMETLESAVNYAWNQGVLVVAGAGNDGANAPMFPAGYANAMAIGSTDELDNHSCFSNYADNYISVAAPGENILVAVPNQGYGIGSGTSLSSPLVAGLGGLLLSQNPLRTNSQLKTLIENTAIDLSPPGVDTAFGYGRIDAFRAVTNDTSQVTPPDGLFSTSSTATGYAHARKLVRDSSGTLHIIWHTHEDTTYRVRHATSNDDGSSWKLEPDVFNSSIETYHPALASDGQNLYVAIPSRSDVGQPYQILFTRKSIADGNWTAPESLMGGTFNTVRPDLYFDQTNGKLHLVASSLDDSPHIYYLSSGDLGASWTGPVVQVNPSTGTTGADSSTRYATIHANGDNLLIAARTVNSSLFTYYYLHTVRSTDGGQTWFDQTKISSYFAFLTGEYGVSLAGVGDRVYMGYEVGSNLYFRYHNGTAWSDYETLELGDSENVNKWPSITQSDDGQAWLMFEVNGELFMRHYDGATWAAKELINSGNYANLKLGTNGDRVEWVASQCNGAPFLVSYDFQSFGSNGLPTANFSYSTTDLTATFSDTSTDNDGTIVTWDWDFGDGYSSSIQNPVHSYAAADTYTVSLTVTDNDGGSDTASQDITVTEPPNVPPSASFTYSTTDLTATFSDTSTDSDGTIVTWDWDFGDGYSSSIQNPVHAYAAAGTYMVSLTVTDNDGGSDTASQDITVAEPPNVPPSASFTYSTTDLTATFSDTSTDGDGTIVSWAWDFGDGNNSSIQNPIHSYAAAGTYTVSLTVIDNDGGSDIVNQSVTVNEPPIIVDFLATGEIHVAGTVSGDYFDTQTDNGISEAINERDSGGKPVNRYSFLEHKWIFNVSPGNVMTLYANVWSSHSNEGDFFKFAYSTDDNNYTEMFTVDNNSNPSDIVVYPLPASIQGTIYIQVTDSDHTAGNREKDSVYVDHLFIRSETQSGNPPESPSGLGALAVSPIQIELFWIDNSDNEYGFEIDRSLDSTNWTQIDSVGENIVEYSDTSVSPKTTYYYKVRAFNGSGASADSTVVSITTPDGLSLDAVGYKIKGKHTVDLSWGGGSIETVDIYREGTIIVYSDPDFVHTDFMESKGGGSYTYQVCDSSNPAICSNSVQIDF
jgi:PKD repeat protein